MSHSRRSHKYMVEMSVPTFDGKDPLLVFRLLAEFVNSCGSLTLDQAEAVEILPSSVTDTAYESIFTAKGTATSQQGGEFTWPRAPAPHLRHGWQNPAGRGGPAQRQAETL